MPHLPTSPAHLGLGATATVEPAFTDESWYAAYAARHAADGIEGRLVSQYDFAESWTSWEVHPHGAELVICTAGALTLHQQHADGTTDTVTLAPGDYAINPPGTWHTADVPAGVTATAIFITPGEGTDHRPR
jgi:mannose-6-phosphate isomerase-like protein (cupin superfamily)